MMAVFQHPALHEGPCYFPLHDAPPIIEKPKPKAKRKGPLTIAEAQKMMGPSVYWQKMEAAIKGSVVFGADDLFVPMPESETEPEPVPDVAKAMRARLGRKFIQGL